MTDRNAPQPQGQYVPAKRHGDLIFVSGMTSRENGKLLFMGQVELDTPVEAYRIAVELAAENSLTAAKSQLIAGEQLAVLSLTVYVNAPVGYTRHSRIADLASRFMEEHTGGWGYQAGLQSGLVRCPETRLSKCRWSPLLIAILRDPPDTAFRRLGTIEMRTDVRITFRSVQKGSTGRAKNNTTAQCSSQPRRAWWSAHRRGEVVLLFLASIRSRTGTDSATPPASFAVSQGVPADALAGFCLRHCGTNDRCHSTDAQCLRAMSFALGVTDRSQPLDRISKFQLTLPGRSAR
ncbi:RidA family protein (plasmid) [Sinorhizobium meliloti]|nr:RidA family protein [Sinorhizobium meliloti]